MIKKKTTLTDDDLHIIDLDKEDLDALDKQDNSSKVKLGSLNKYISSTYLWMHMLMITLYTVLLMTIVTRIEQRYMWHLFMISSFTFTFSIWGVYYLSRKIKIKKNKLQEHKVKFIWRVLYIGLSLVWMCVVSMICGLTQVAFMF